MCDELTDVRNFIGLHEMTKDKNLWKAAAAEFIGTLLLVLVGCGSCMQGSSPDGSATVPQIAFTFGLIVATMVQSISHISGGHINPAVTLGFLVARRISILRAVTFIVSQLAGAIAGAAILQGVIAVDKTGNLCCTLPPPSVSDAKAFGVEFMITLVLVLVIFGVCDDGRSDVKGSAPLAIGFSITACHLAFIPVTGSSMNPARSFGPSVISDTWTRQWIYWIGPITGGLCASLLYTFVFRQKTETVLQIHQIT